VADGPQLIGKTMGTQNSFDLNQQLGRWRHELAEQGVRAAEANELESHLHESTADFQTRGLSEEEAFWIARHRLGSAPDLAEQFAKVDPARVWRDRIFWAAALMLAVLIWNQFWPFSANWLANALSRADSDRYWSFLIGNFFAMLPLLVVAVLLARGRLLGTCAWFARLFRTQRQFARLSTIVVGGLLCIQAVRTLQLSQTINDHGGGLTSHISFWGTFLSNAAWPMTLVAILLAFGRRERPSAA